MNRDGGAYIYIYILASLEEIKEYGEVDFMSRGLRFLILKLVSLFVYEWGAPVNSTHLQALRIRSFS